MIPGVQNWCTYPPSQTIGEFLHVHIKDHWSRTLGNKIYLRARNNQVEQVGYTSSSRSKSAAYSYACTAHPPLLVDGVFRSRPLIQQYSTNKGLHVMETPRMWCLTVEGRALHIHEWAQDNQSCHRQLPVPSSATVDYKEDNKQRITHASCVTNHVVTGRRPRYLTTEWTKSPSVSFFCNAPRDFI
jgi:hypothetical protein